MNVEIKGYPMEFNLQKLAKCSDLIYFDGPLLSHFIDGTGDNYLLYWLESDERFNRWMIVRTTAFQLQSYMAKRITLRDVILNPCDSFVFVTDIDDSMNCSNTQCVPLANIPTEYLPDDDSFYAFRIENATEYSTLYNPKLLSFFLRQLIGQSVMSDMPINYFAHPTSTSSSII